MLSAELFQARRWCQKITLSSRFSFPSPVFSVMFLATFSVMVKHSGMAACEHKVCCYPSQVTAAMHAAVVLLVLIF